MIRPVTTKSTRIQIISELLNHLDEYGRPDPLITLEQARSLLCLPALSLDPETLGEAERD